MRCGGCVKQSSRQVQGPTQVHTARTTWSGPAHLSIQPPSSLVSTLSFKINTLFPPSLSLRNVLSPACNGLAACHPPGRGLPSPTCVLSLHTLLFFALILICAVIYCTAVVKSQSPPLDPELRECVDTSSLSTAVSPICTRAPYTLGAK